MNDHNLDDLIIDDIKPERNKGKGILTIVALLITLLIVAIVMTRVFLGESDQNTTTLEQKQEDMISPELRLDASSLDPEADRKELEQLSSMMEETLIEKPADTQKDLSSSQADPIKSETVQIDEASEPLTITSALKEPTAVEPAEAEKAPAPEVTPQAAPIAAPKVVKAATEKPVHKPAPSKPKASSSSYYIQVGSFSKQPSKRFLSVITKNGFHYKLSKGKLLIGPYSSDAAARRDLPRVKDKINKGAFVKHL